MDDEMLAGDLEFIAARTFGIVGDIERAETFRLAAARLRTLKTENAKLRDVRAVVLAYERITDTQYALGPFAGDEHLNPEFLCLLRALHATMEEPRTRLPQPLSVL